MVECRYHEGVSSKCTGKTEALRENFGLAVGEMAEWVQGTGIKNRQVPRGFGGSNPPLPVRVSRVVESIGSGKIQNLRQFI